MATIVTPGRAAPLLSATLPLICAVAWAHALVVARSRRSTPTKVPRERFIQGLLNEGSRIRHKYDCWPDALINWRAVYPLSVGPVLLSLPDGQICHGVPGVVDPYQDE